MARMTGVKEKVHSPIYDAFVLKDDSENFKDKMTDPRMIRFFVDVQEKTRLETNLQASGVLPSKNTFEARAMRVVFSNPPPVLEHPDDSVDFMQGVIFRTVTTLLVGEKEAISTPTYMLPGGSGLSGSNDNVVNHGDPDPAATFRFADPVFIEPQQNFRVEMSFPQDVPDEVADKFGPRRIWVVLDGYLTRDVQ